MTRRVCWNALFLAAVVLGSIVAPGCGGDQVKTGTQVGVTDQMQKEAEASSKYLEGQGKAPASPKK